MAVAASGSHLIGPYQFPKNLKMTQTLVFLNVRKTTEIDIDNGAAASYNPDPASYFRYEILACSNLQSFLSDF